MKKIRIAIVGATGYTGSELVRILARHPHAEIVAITSESRAGERFSDVHPFFTGIADQELVPADRVETIDADLLFFALPHGVSMEYALRWKDRDVRIIDLSGDFRLSSPEVYEAWYPKAHAYREGFAQAAYGLPELFRDEMGDARIIANPGCYPTCSLLAAAPLIRQELADPASLIIDAKSGVTGAGVKAKEITHFPNVNDNFKAYGLKKHRHTIEIEEKLGKWNDAAMIQFTPHLLPIDRGILATVYALPSGTLTEKELTDGYREICEREPFLRWRDRPPAVKEVRGTNFCDLHATYDKRTGRILVLAAIDNLVKGAAGQAVQNMNLIFGLPETTGLDQIPLHP